MVIYADTEEALGPLAAAIPAILVLLGGQQADAVTETIDGIKVRSLEAKASPLGAAIHFAQLGTGLAIGSDRKAIAACLRADPARGIGSALEVGNAVKAAGKSSFAGVFNWVDALLPPAPAKQNIAPPPVSGPRPIRADGEPIETPAMPLVPREVLAALQGLPPLVVSIGREKDELRFEFRQRDPHCLRAKAVESWFQWLATSRREFYGNAQAVETDVAPLILPK
jgi:hypothetical protein